ncbi:cation-translocating P-type ATPase [Eubacterium xylanophilum]|uniref:cation-translocating P-type ATPase n=1 Tax=Eubacterium xylanophilum TaxID=39497 RepID=UPI0004AF9631|nr:cation-translocating P-type ATPase [Eubacterium xylanophilum]
MEKKIIGLTTEQVREAEYRGEVNVQQDKSQKTVKDIVKENVLTYFNLIFAILAVLLLFAGAFKSMTFLPIIVANTLIGIFQELKAKKVLDSLSVLTQPTVPVYRNGEKQEIAIEKLVKNDLVVFEEGAQICADAVVVRGEASVNESLLTGESDEIAKKKGDELMSGSFVVAGRCLGRLTKVGKESYISKLTAQAKEMQGHEQSEMVRSINQFVIGAGIAIIPVGIMLFVQSMIAGKGFSPSVTSMVAAVVGMIPEGLYLLVSITLAAGATRLAKKKVMLHDMKCIETLARVDVLCVDKTGTITEPDMVVHGLDIVDEDEDELNVDVERLLASYILALPDNNITMKALRARFMCASPISASDTMPFTSRFKYSSVKMKSESYMLGAPDILLASNYEKWRERIEKYSAKGYRVLAFAKSQGDIPREGIGERDVQPIAFITISNPIRSGAKDTFEYFAKQGVDIKVISGDNPVTVSEVASRAGIKNAEHFIDARQLSSGDDVADAVEKYTVFGRVTPEQKRMIVKALQAAGHTVAMTGDGVNDILAMKDADCSIAMASGSDAAVQSSQVALLDSDFSRMPHIVAEGRRVINNIERSATLFLTKNIFSLMLAIFAIINVLSYPLQPEQVSLISMFNIGIPAFFLALEPNEQRIQGRFMTKVLLKGMPAALTNFFAIAALVIFGRVFGVAETDISVASTMLMAIVGFIILFNISVPVNKYRAVVIIGCIIGIIVFGICFHNMFTIQKISQKCVMLFVLFAIATEPCMRYLTMLFTYIEKKILMRDKRAKAIIE